MLNITRFTQTLGGDLYAITKNYIFVGKWYTIDANKISQLHYMLGNFNIWHARLCHVNKCIILNFSNLSLTPKLSINYFEQCDFFSQTKITKSSHK